MSVRTSHNFHNYTLTQTGPTTAKMTFSPSKATGPKPETKTPNAAVVWRTNALGTVKAFLATLFGIQTVAPCAEPRYPASTAKGEPAGRPAPGGDAVFKFTSERRKHESALIQQTTLFVIVGSDGIFVGGVTQPVAPQAVRAPRAPRPTTLQSRPREPSREETVPARRHRSQERLPSSAGSEASGIPLSGRRAFGAPETGIPPRPIEPAVVETPEPPPAPVETAAAAPQYGYEAYEAALSTRPVDDTVAPAAQAPVGIEHNPQVLTQYATALNDLSATDAFKADLGQRLITYTQARQTSANHAKSCEYEAQRCTDEAKHLDDEAEQQQQDHLKAQILRDDAKRFRVEAERWKQRAENHRVEAEQHAQKVADVEDQMGMLA